VNARVDRVVFGATDPKAGAVGSLADVCRDARLNHRLVVQGGVLGDECGDVLRRFFRARRDKARAPGGAP
jgi:tRNA(adenine34) deaminase